MKLLYGGYRTEWKKKSSERKNQLLYHKMRGKSEFKFKSRHVYHNISKIQRTMKHLSFPRKQEEI